MRYNSQTVKFNLLKHAIQWVLVYLLFTKLRNHQPCLITEYFHYPQKNPVPPGSHSPLLSSPQALSQGVCPFPIFQVDSVCGLLFPASFTLCVLKVRLCCSMPHCFTLFTYLLVFFKYMHTFLSIILKISEKLL